jgi:hypothetical protein
MRRFTVLHFIKMLQKLFLIWAFAQSFSLLEANDGNYSMALIPSAMSNSTSSLGLSLRPNSSQSFLDINHASLLNQNHTQLWAAGLAVPLQILSPYLETIMAKVVETAYGKIQNAFSSKLNPAASQEIGDTLKARQLSDENFSSKVEAADSKELAEILERRRVGPEAAGGRCDIGKQRFECYQWIDGKNCWQGEECSNLPKGAYHDELAPASSSTSRSLRGTNLEKPAAVSLKRHRLGPEELGGRCNGEVKKSACYEWIEGGSCWQGAVCSALLEGPYKNTTVSNASKKVSAPINHRQLDYNDDCGNEGPGPKCINGNTHFECYQWIERRTCYQPENCTTYTRSDGSHYTSCTPGYYYDCSITHVNPVPNSYRLCEWGAFPCRPGGICLTPNQATDMRMFVIGTFNEINQRLFSHNITGVNYEGTPFVQGSYLAVGKGALFPFGTNFWAATSSKEASDRVIQATQTAMANVQTLRTDLIAYAAKNAKLKSVIDKFLNDGSAQWSMVRWFFQAALPTSRQDLAVCDDCLYFGKEFEVRLDEALKCGGNFTENASYFMNKFSGSIFNHCGAIQAQHSSCGDEAKALGGYFSQLPLILKQRIGDNCPAYSQQ